MTETIMTPAELRNLLAQPHEVRENPFIIAKSISRLCHSPKTLAQGRELVIRALEHYDAFAPLDGVLDALLQQVGLFPYADPLKLSIVGQIAYEYHRPLDFEAVDGDVVFHEEQAEVYRELMSGHNYVLSAPTSFGKSLTIDALLAARAYSIVVIIVPTISLIDETRRRLARFRNTYKIITHPSQALEDRNVLVLTQERAIEREDTDKIDLLIIDEFYKLDMRGNIDSDRAAILNEAFYRMSKRASQIYLLGPNIHSIPRGFGVRFRCRFKRTDFNTVVSEVTCLASEPSREEAFLRLVDGLSEPTLVYCRSPKQANRVLQLLAERAERLEEPELDRASSWIAEAYHPEWSLRSALLKGVGIHHGRVPRALAHLNVRLFNARKLQFLVCTSSLIEGVNTVAKNVVIYEGKLANGALDFFTFQNIRGRAGRMFQHFVGRVFILGQPPDFQLEKVDIPVFTQGEATPLGLLIQIDDQDLTPQSRQRLQRVVEQDDLSVAVLKENSHVDPERQLIAARRIRQNAAELHPLLAWTGFPDWNQLSKTCQVIFEDIVQPPLHGIFSGAQLAFRLKTMQRYPNAQQFILAVLETDQHVSNVDEAVELVFLFQRNWALFAFPRYLRALDKIQREIFERLGMLAGEYSIYAHQVENLFLRPELPALEEYGVPIQLSLKLQERLTLGEGLDRALVSLRELRLDDLDLSEFERELIEDARSAL